MKFHLAINMERMDPGIGMKEVARHTLSTPVALPSADPEADALDYLYQVSGMRTFAVELPTETTFDEVLVTTRPLTGLVVPAVGGLLTGP